MKNIKRIHVLIILLIILIMFYVYHLTYIKSRHNFYTIYNNTPQIFQNNIYHLLNKAINIFNLQVNGVIHIGANIGQEQNIYDHFQVKNVLWVEADPKLAKELNKSISRRKNIKIANFAASDINGSAFLFKTNNNGLSSSFLKLKKHKIIFPDIVQTEQIPIQLKKIDTYFKESKNTVNKKQYNFLVLGIQGAELLALKGAVNTLKQIDGIITEINYDELYETCATLVQLDSFLIENNFIRIDTCSETKGHGDALYIKKSLLII